MVDIDPATWKERLQAAHWPELSRSTLKIWEGWTTDLGPMPPQTVLSIVGLVSDGRPQAALDTLSALGGAGGGFLVSTGLRGPTPVTLMECDFGRYQRGLGPTAGRASSACAGQIGSGRYSAAHRLDQVLRGSSVPVGAEYWISAESVHRSRPVNVCSNERRGA